MVLVQQQLGDHIGYNIIHWIISQSGIWYTKFNENIQSNLRTIESGVAVIDEILTPQDDDLLYELNNQFVDHDRAYYYHQNIRLNDNYYVNGNENYGNQLHGNLRGVFLLIFCIYLPDHCHAYFFFFAHISCVMKIALGTQCCWNQLNFC